MNTNQVNQAFEKRREIEGYVLSDGTPDNEDYGVSRDWFQYGYEASTQATQSEINSLKERVAELQSHLSNQVIEISLNDITLEAYASKIAELQANNNQLREALRDMLNGWIYIRETHGDLYGVGWDRAQKKAEKVLSSTPTQSCEIL